MLLAPPFKVHQCLNAVLRILYEIHSLLCLKRLFPQAFSLTSECQSSTSLSAGLHLCQSHKKISLISFHSEDAVLLFSSKCVDNSRQRTVENRSTNWWLDPSNVSNFPLEKPLPIQERGGKAIKR